MVFKLPCEARELCSQRKNCDKGLFYIFLLKIDPYVGSQVLGCKDCATSSSVKTKIYF